MLIYFKMSLTSIFGKMVLFCMKEIVTLLGNLLIGAAFLLIAYKINVSCLKKINKKIDLFINLCQGKTHENPSKHLFLRGL